MRARSCSALVSMVATAAGVLGTAACGGGANVEGIAVAAEGQPQPLVVDTDLASDDLVALAFLLSSPRAEVRAITVSGTGEVRCPAGLDVVRGLLTVTGDEDIPVACGRERPLAGDQAFPTEWRDSADTGWGLELPEVEAVDSGDTVDASELLAQSLRGGDATLLALGPLTNVADAFRDRPELARRTSSVVVMGGAVDVAGNVFVADVAPVAEWNFFVDPTAAAEVVDSGVPITLVALDATNDAPVTPAFVDELQDVAGSEAAELAAELLSTNPMVASGEASFWDPLAAAVALDPGLVTTESVPITVATGESDESGRTVRDEDGTQVTVATGAHRDSLEGLLLATWG